MPEVINSANNARNATHAQHNFFFKHNFFSNRCYLIKNKLKKIEVEKKLNSTLTRTTQANTVIISFTAMWRMSKVA